MTTQYTPSRSYLIAAGLAIALGAFSAWLAADYIPGLAAAALFWLCASVLLFLATRPPVRISEEALTVGRRTIPWPMIRRVDRTGWISPLLVHLTQDNGKRILLIHAGDLGSANSLLRQIRKRATMALIDGFPHASFWGDAPEDDPGAGRLALPPHHILRPEDEEDVKRLYRRLKSVGHLDSNPSNEE